MDKPFPAGEVLGSTLVLQHRNERGGYEYQQRAMWFTFDYEPTNSETPWKCSMVDEIDMPVESISGRGETPLAAMEAMVKVHDFMNGGQHSELVERCLPYWRAHFYPDGSAKPYAPADVPQGDFTVAA